MKRNNFNIVEINNNNYGSTGHIMLDIAKTARLDGFNVYTCCKNSKAANRFNNENQILIGNRYTRSICEHLAFNTGLKNHYNVLNTKLFINKLKEIKPDLIHIHNIHDTFINFKILVNYINEYNIPVIWTLHDCWTFTGQCTYFDLTGCDKWISGCHNCPQIHKYPNTKVDKTNILYQEKKDLLCSIKNLTIVTPSKWLAGLVKRSYLKDSKTIVINNGIDLNIFKPTESNLRERYGLKNKYIILGVSTGWGERKGLDDFIKLANSLDSNYQIVLVGTNEEIDKKLPSNIISIHRTYNQKELAEIYSASDVFVNPTKEENFPTVNIESMACGTPVITYDTGGSKEMLNNKTGIIIKKNDFDRLVKNIKDVCTNNPFKKTDLIKQASNYDMDKKFKDYVDLYKNIIG